MHSPSATFQVVEEGHVTVTFLHRELVDDQLFDVAQIDVLPGLVDVVLQDPPDGILVDVQVTGYASYRHLVAQGQYHRLDVQGESLVGPGPGKFDLSHVVLGAGESCPSFEVDEDVQLILRLVQLDIAYELWGLQPQDHLKELLAIHERRQRSGEAISLPTLF